MSKNDREHFDEYRHQTKVKHEILSKYLKAYYGVLKSTNKNLVYIDAFAGRGTYTEKQSGQTIAGSPLLALKLFADTPDFTSRLTSIFIETDKDNHAVLEKNIEEFYAANDHIREPVVIKGTFAEEVSKILDDLSEDGGKLAPTFLFVDPCGVAGTAFSVIERVMQYDSCEAFIFFNIDGVRRVLGLGEVSDTLKDLFGSEARAQKVYDAIRQCKNSQDKEKTIISYYKRLLTKKLGATYVTAFPVEYENRKATSHYFIHATKHPLGFKIMKDIMWKIGQTQDGNGLAFDQASISDSRPLFRPDWEDFKQSILDGIADGPVKIRQFYRDWVQRSDDLFSEPAYRSALLEMEQDGQVIILDKTGNNPAPAATRPKRKGEFTLGEDYFVQLPD